MLMYATICQNNGNANKIIATFITCFKGSLRGWYNNYLTDQKRIEIMSAVCVCVCVSQPIFKIPPPPLSHTHSYTLIMFPVQKE